MLKRLIALLIVLLPIHGALPPVDGITTGTCTFTPLFETTGVVCAFTGDDDGDATLAVQYKVTGGPSWIDAYTPMIDRRTTINSLSNSANVNQGRVKIVGLSDNTSYDFQATWTDPDGVSGTNPRTATETTRTYTPPTGGSTYYISPTGNDTTGDGSSGNPWLTLAKAISIQVAGDTIKCKTGSYAMGTISASGTSVAYRQLQPDTGATCTWTVTSNNVGIISADYWRITASGTGGRMVFSTAPLSTIIISTGSDNLYLEDFEMSDVANGSLGLNSYAAFQVTGTNTNINILRAQLSGTSVVATDSGPQVNGVYFGTLSNSVICDNIITGQTSTDAGWWDAIGNGTNNSFTNQTNNDICDNQFLHYRDDAVELDGGGINVGYWNNESYTTRDTTGSIGVGLSMAPIWIGPTYVARNWIHPSSTLSLGLKFLSGSADVQQQTIFFFHNTVSTSEGGGSGRECISYARGLMSLNNIFVCRGDVSYANSALPDVNTIRNTYNYDAMYSTTGGNIATDWAGTSTDYSCLSTPCSPSFRTGTGNELNGTGVNPSINTSTGAITSSSSAYNTGVSIANFNGVNSVWPGSLDMGFYIVGGSGPTPGNSGAITTASVSSTTLTLNWTKATDSITPQVDLEYEICRAPANTISTVAGCEAATIIQAFTPDIATFNVTGLTPLTLYYFNVVVRNDSGSKTAYVPVSATTTCGATKVVFTSQPLSGVLNASLGSVSVSVQNASNTTCTDSSASITLSKNGSATWGTLTSSSSLTKSASSGVATWTDLSITTTPGTGSIDAASSGLTGAVSNSVTILAASGIGPGKLRIGR